MGLDVMPSPPDGYRTLRTCGGRMNLFGDLGPVQTTHLIISQSQGTLCGKTLFDRGDTKADIPGWSVGGGTYGPGITQVRCDECWMAASAIAGSM